MKKLGFLALSLFILSAMGLTAQEMDPLALESDTGPYVKLMHFVDVEVVLPDEELLFPEDLEIGMSLPVGSTIITGEFGTAELELVPNQSIVKLAGNTNLSVDDLAGLGDSKTNALSMTTGKIRIVAASLTGKDQDFILSGDVGACGVRGTDFGMDINPGLGTEEAFVLEGLVDYSKKGGGPSIALGAGMLASPLGDNFAPIPIPQGKLQLLQQELGFEVLDVQTVPTSPPEATPEPTEEPTPEPEASDAPAPSDEPVETAPPGTDNIPDWLKELLGMEIGSITIGEEIYGKVVFQPTFSIGKLKTALYLPIIYKTDMFDPDDWYRPKGNDEWSFGTDQEGIPAIAYDALSDLFLKIKYLQWGEQRDDFWIKLGNLNNFTIGHGLVMYNYANDADFPSLRRVGVNMGVEYDKWGYELVINDLAQAEVMGGRVFFKIADPVSLGVTAITDINPGADLPDTYDPGVGIPTNDMIGNPLFINMALDLDIPFSEADALSMIAFIDAAGMIPYFRSDGGAGYSDVKKGLGLESMYSTENGLQNYGVSGGIFGKFLIIDYRLSLNYFTGAFKPAFYNTAYDRTRGEKAIEMAGLVQNPGNDIYNDTLGVYGEGHYELPKVFSIEMGYMAPLAFKDEGGIEMAQDDEFHLKATIASDVIPVIDLHGSLTYDRTNLVPMFKKATSSTGKSFGLLDEYTVLKGELVYGVSENVDLILLLSGAAARDDDGNVIYEDDGSQRMATTFSIETSVHF